MAIPRIVTDKAYATYEVQLEKQVKEGDIPGHIAIIMDGNRRYAKEVLNAEPIEGHKLGRDKLDEVLHWCLNLGVKHLTVYAFSTENFSREQDEIIYIMDMMAKSLHELADDEEVHKHRVKVRIIGDKDMLPDDLLESIQYAEEMTKDYDNFVFTMAVAYGGRQDIVNAVREIASKVKNGEIDIDDINEYDRFMHIYQ